MENLYPECIPRLSKAIQFRTVSDVDENGTGYLIDPNETTNFLAFLKSEFSEVFSSENVELMTVNEHSLLIHVKANPIRSNIDYSNEPFLLIAHTDVVPVDENEWSVPPFEGLIEDGYLYGRGTLDDKSSVMAILEAVKDILSSSLFTCQRDFYIALTHDEEVTGNEGAKRVAETLEQHLNGRTLEFVLDEGLIILENFKEGLPPVALIGIAEKGYATVRLSIKKPGGHSSVPPKSTAITEMCEAIRKINDYNFPTYLQNTPMHQTLDALAPFLPFVQRILVKLIRYTDFILRKVISLDPVTRLQLQTSQICTRIFGGIKDNVIPVESSAIINFRLHPNDSVSGVKSVVQQLLGNEFDFKFVGDPFSASDCSSTNSYAYESISRAIEQTFSPQKLLIAPALLTGSTDSKHFRHLTRDTYRFNAFWLKREDIIHFHGHDERISLANYVKQIQFYRTLLMDCAFLDKSHFR